MKLGYILLDFTVCETSVQQVSPSTKRSQASEKTDICMCYNYILLIFRISFLSSSSFLSHHT